LPHVNIGPAAPSPNPFMTAPPPWDPWQAASIAVAVAAASHADARTIARLQQERLGALVEAAVHGSRLMREAIGPRDPSRLALHELPVSTKAALMARFDDWVTDPDIRLADLRRFVADPSCIATGYLGRYAVWESSGSTGEPAVFVQDARALAVYDALESLRRPGRLSPALAWQAALRGERIAFVGATGGHFASTVSIERLRALNPWLAGAVHGVSFLLPPEALAAQLEAIAPTVLATYPSMAVILSDAQLAGRLNIAPREVWTGGETLGPAARTHVEQAFDAHVVDSYGCSECLALASECAHGRLHANADWAILESVDGQGQPVPAGEPGARTLLTNLANHVQPILRYDLGDEIVFDARRCACGSALPALRVRGRFDESLVLAGRGRGGAKARGGTVSVSPLAICTVLEDEAGLYRFQVVQAGPSTLDLRTTEGEPRADEAASRLRAFLAEQGAPGVAVRSRPGAAMARGRSGKIARVVGPARG
jgi:phenylacetate-coenzyme A ligase PaaK-like adenylate-forming protein